jgi:uncharacterized protein RhaS with RHS repeats
MYNYKARIYSPMLGRFLQTDPIGYGDGMNWYNYVGSDPTNQSDSSGLFNCNRNNVDQCQPIRMDASKHRVFLQECCLRGV